MGIDRVKLLEKRIEKSNKEIEDKKRQVPSSVQEGGEMQELGFGSTQL